jgi:selenocysteine lyase/cysteine desulfurase
MVSRRSALAALAATPAVALAGGARASAPTSGPLGPADFQLSGTYLNAAYTHPMPLCAAEAVNRFLQGRVDPGLKPVVPRDAAALFARLINARPEEIAKIPSTSYAESMVINALGLAGAAGAGVVTDILHFDGSLYAYGQLEKQGLKVTVLPMTAQGRIDMNRLEAAVVPGVRLVAVSAVSMINGFEHDLKTVCEIAHRQGALVYVDAIQAAGASPIDVKASGVDFLAASSFKWLMGDFGCGFLYVRPDVMSRLRRPELGYHQIATMAYHALPGDTPGPGLFESTADERTAAGMFEVGSVSIEAEVAASVSLRRILETGVGQIEQRRQPWLEKLRDRLGRKYPCMTPAGSRSSILTFSLIGANKRLQAQVTEAQVRIQLYENRFRISPSVYNSMADIDRAIDALSG